LSLIPNDLWVSLFIPTFLESVTDVAAYSRNSNIKSSDMIPHDQLTMVRTLLYSHMWSCKLLTKVCTTVGTTPVLQSKAAQNSKRKKENCTEYAKTSKIIF
jgi:hypothetical protein